MLYEEITGSDFTEAEVEQFREAWREGLGKEIDPELARKELAKLVRLYLIVAISRPVDAEGEKKSNNG